MTVISESFHALLYPSKGRPALGMEEGKAKHEAKIIVVRCLGQDTPGEASQAKQLFYTAERAPGLASSRWAGDYFPDEGRD